MPIVPPSAVTDAWNELNIEDDEKLATHVAQFRAEQPILAGFLQAAEEAIAERDDRGLIFFYGLWAWLAFRKCGGATHEVTEERIEAAWENNEEEMHQLEAASQLRWLNEARSLTSEYRQMALLGAMTESIMDPGLTDRPRTDDLSGIILLHVKTGIDALDGD
ncbi:MAG: hypothetical protein JWL81_1539 [Verrucomicrobiales bacterium]|nr:hypothetical protein [Verrucomicrobiales bacterium]